MKHIGWILLALLVPPVAAWAAGEALPRGGWVYVYEDGSPVGYAVGTDFTFREVPAEEIHAGNAALLGGVLGYGPWRGNVGYGWTEYDDDVDAAEFYGRRRGGPFVHDLFVRDYLSPGDWQGIFGEYYDPGALYMELDKSGPHWSFDSTSFQRYGYVYSQDPDAYQRHERRRRMHRFTWRRGSMDGGVWRLQGVGYEVNVGPGAPQAVDVRFKRLEAEFRSVESNYVLEGGAYAGKYVSHLSLMDNRFTGARLEGQWWPGGDLGLQADARVTQFNPRLQDGAVTRSAVQSSLLWELGDALALTGRAQHVAEDTDLAANSHLTGFTDLGGNLSYRPCSWARFNLDYRHRQAEAERLCLEDDAALLLVTGEPVLTREILAPFREDTSAESDRWALRAHLPFSDRLYFGGSIVEERFSELPAVGCLAADEPLWPYFADERHRCNIHLTYDVGSSGNLTARCDRQRRTNNDRRTEYRLERHALGYSGPLTGRTRWHIGLSTHDTSVNVPGEADDWDRGSWNYELSLVGERNWAKYRLSWARQLVEDNGGDYDGVGLELTFTDVPLYLSAWWRERGLALGGLAAFDDAGVNLGYHIEWR